MLAFLSRLFGQFALVGCCLSLNVLLVSFGVLIRQLPALADFSRRALHSWLVLSYRFYHWALTPLAAALSPLGVDLLAGLPRLLISLSLSLGAGLGLMQLLGWSLHWWLLALFALHGLLVGGLWDELLEPGGIRLGERL